MPSIHIMHGFIGFGKTTTAKIIARENSAVRLEIDGFMAKLFGRNPIRDGYWKYSERVKGLIWDLAKEVINNGIDVVIDHGFWTKQERADAWRRAKQITPNVYMHCLKCDFETAKARTIARTADNQAALEITESDFEASRCKFEPMQEAEAKHYTIVLHET